MTSVNAVVVPKVPVGVPDLDMLALRQGSKALVQHFASSIGSVFGKQPGNVPQPDLGAFTELAAHGFQGLLHQLILIKNIHGYVLVIIQIVAGFAFMLSMTQTLLLFANIHADQVNASSASCLNSLKRHNKTDAEQVHR